MLIIAFIFVFCCGFLSSMMYSTLHASALDQMHRRQAEQIVEALKKYKNDKGGFPRDLSHLSNQYISQSFLTTEKWMYFSNSPDGFRLEYDAQSNFLTYGYSENGSKSGWYDWNSM